MKITLPDPLVRGNVSSRSLREVLSHREEEYEEMFEANLQNYEKLGRYYIPPFQRPAVWTEDQKCKLVESIHLGISIGSIVVTEEGPIDPKTGRWPVCSDLIVDGQQRLRAIRSYIDQGLRIFKGTDHEHVWDDLERSQKIHFLSVPIGYISIREHDMNAIKEIYNRLNFGGTMHTEDQLAQ